MNYFYHRITVFVLIHIKHLSHRLHFFVFFKYAWFHIRINAKGRKNILGMLDDVSLVFLSHGASFAFHNEETSINLE